MNIQENYSMIVVVTCVKINNNLKANRYSYILKGIEIDDYGNKCYHIINSSGAEMRANFNLRKYHNGEEIVEIAIWPIIDRRLVIDCINSTLKLKELYDQRSKVAQDILDQLGPHLILTEGESKILCN